MTSYSFTSSFTSSFTISLSAVFFFFLLLLDSSAFSSGALMADLLPYFFPLTAVGDLSPSLTVEFCFLIFSLGSGFFFGLNSGYARMYSSSLAFCC